MPQHQPSQLPYSPLPAAQGPVAASNTTFGSPSVHVPRLAPSQSVQPGMLRPQHSQQNQWMPQVYYTAQQQQQQPPPQYNPFFAGGPASQPHAGQQQSSLARNHSLSTPQQQHALFDARSPPQQPNAPFDARSLPRTEARSLKPRQTQNARVTNCVNTKLPQDPAIEVVRKKVLARQKKDNEEQEQALQQRQESENSQQGKGQANLRISSAATRDGPASFDKFGPGLGAGPSASSNMMTKNADATGGFIGQTEANSGTSSFNYPRYASMQQNVESTSGKSKARPSDPQAYSPPSKRMRISPQAGSAQMAPLASVSNSQIASTNVNTQGSAQRNVTASGEPSATTVSMPDHALAPGLHGDKAPEMQHAKEAARSTPNSVQAASYPNQPMQRPSTLSSVARPPTPGTSTHSTGKAGFSTRPAPLRQQSTATQQASPHLRESQPFPYQQMAASPEPVRLSHSTDASRSIPQPEQRSAMQTRERSPAVMQKQNGVDYAPRQIGSLTSQLGQRRQPTQSQSQEAARKIAEAKQEAENTRILGEVYRLGRKWLGEKAQFEVFDCDYIGPEKDSRLKEKKQTKQKSHHCVVLFLLRSESDTVAEMVIQSDIFEPDGLAKPVGLGSMIGTGTVTDMGTDMDSVDIEWEKKTDPRDAYSKALENMHDKLIQICR